MIATIVGFLAMPRWAELRRHNKLRTPIQCVCVFVCVTLFSQFFNKHWNCYVSITWYSLAAANINLRVYSRVIYTICVKRSPQWLLPTIYRVEWGPSCPQQTTFQEQLCHNDQKHQVCPTGIPVAVHTLESSSVETERGEECTLTATNTCITLATEG